MNIKASKWVGGGVVGGFTVWVGGVGDWRVHGVVWVVVGWVVGELMGWVHILTHEQLQC